MVIDHGEVDQPTMVRLGTTLFGAWIHNYNGFDELDGMTAAPTGAPRTFVLVRSKAPIEHPFAFVGPGGRPGLVFSWQKYGNYDVFLLLINHGTKPTLVERRLTRAQFYSFYPQAITDARGDVDLLHLESCCSQQQFRVEWDRFTASGQKVAPTSVLTSIQERGANTLQRGEAIGKDGSGQIWAASTIDSGAILVHANADGVPVETQPALDPFPEQPGSIALALGAHGGYAIWEHDNGLGTDLESRHFDESGMSGVERIEYLPGQQHNAHAGYVGNRYRVVWESITPSGGYAFETIQHRKAAGPDLAERLGLGLGDPWSAAGLLFGGALGLGVMGTAINLIDALILAAIGVLLVRFLGGVAWRWLIVTALLTGALYALFVSPGLPVLFLTTITALGFGATQFVLAATGGALVFVGLVGQTALRRMDDIYRMAAMAFLGIFFFAFIEAALFVQQELGYI
jgi:hypothetical protein